jgi:hypothetical protein
MAKMGIALAGAALGAWIGGPMGARIGFMIGTAAGNLLFPEKGPKPQKADTSVQASSYGTPISILSGTDRTAGTLIYVRNNEIDARKTKVSGGKGAAMGGASTTTYTYDATFAVLIGKGPIDGVRRIWADTKLIYDKSAETLNDSITNGTAYHAQVDDGRIIVYLGTEDQLPDPTQEAEHGVGEVPAYRGLAYVMFHQLELANFANRIPNITIEYVKDGDIALLLRHIGDTGSNESAFDQCNIDPYGPFYWNKSVVCVDLTTGDRLVSVSPEDQVHNLVMDDPLSPLVPVEFFIGTVCPGPDGFVYIPGSAGINTGGGDIQGYKFRRETMTLVAVAQGITLFPCQYMTLRFFVASSYWFGFNISGDLINIDPATMIAEIAVDSAETSGADESDMADVTPLGTYWWTSGNDTTTSLLCNSEGDVFDLSSTFTNGSLHNIFYYADEDVILCGNGSIIAKVDPITGAVIATCPYNPGTRREPAWRRGPVNGRFITGSASTISIVDIASMTRIQTYDLNDWPTITGSRIAGVYDPFTDSLVYLSTAASNTYQVFLPRVDALDVDRADVITQYSEEVGLTSSQIDVTEVVDTVQGVTVRRQTTGRDALEPIMQSGFVECANIDRKIKFRPKGQSAVLTVDEDDLGASTRDADSGIVQKLTETVEQEVRLPWRVLLRYVNRAAQYDVGAQAASRSRQAVTTQEQMTFDTSEVISDDTAKQIVEKMLFSTWQERTALKFSLPPKYGKLTPMDVITVTRGEISYDVRLTKIDYGPFLQCEGLAQDTVTYLSDSTGAPSNIPQDVLRLIAGSRHFLIDSNAIRDTDDNEGFYIAVSRVTAAGIWRGAQVFKSSDASNFFPFNSYSEDGVFGYASDNLADHHCTTLDTYNTLTVYMTNGLDQLESCTELELYNGANAAALYSAGDWEIIQFMTVVDNGDGSVTLSNLLRGRRGTEAAAAGHNDGDIFVLLSTDTIDRVINDADVGNLRYYKTTSIGGIFDPAGAEAFTNTARALECYAPSHVVGTRDGSNNLTITWVRRDRLGGENDWADAVADVPMSEEDEEYEVDILDAGVVVRTIAITAETAAYSAANQTSDGLTPGDPVDVEVYQLSATNGRGRVTEATV